MGTTKLSRGDWLVKPNRTHSHTGPIIFKRADDSALIEIMPSDPGYYEARDYFACAVNADTGESIAKSSGVDHLGEDSSVTIIGDDIQLGDLGTIDSDDKQRVCAWFKSLAKS